MKKRLLVFILILILAVSLIACQKDSSRTKPGDNNDKTPQPGVGIAIDFEQSLSEIDANLDMWGGRFYWSPDGNYALLNAMSSKPEVADAAAVILADIKNNKLVKLTEGYLINGVSWSKDGKQVVFSTDNELLLYNTSDNTSVKIADNGYMPEFSPDGSKFIYMKDGLWIYNLAGKSSSQITKGKYDTAPIWFSDSKSVFYFRDNGKNLGDGAGNQQVMSVLDTTTKKFDDVDVAMKGKFRDARWLKEDAKLLIRAGWDDGMFYHVLNLENGQLTKDVIPENTYTSVIFDDVNKRVLVTDQLNSSVTDIYDYDMKKLDTVNLGHDKEYPEADYNIGITNLKDNRILYLYANLEKNKGALMISYLADGKQTRVTEYGSYSVPSVSPDRELLAYFENGNKLKVVPIDNLKETDVTKVESSNKAYNELKRMLPNSVGAKWKYIGFAEYGHTMKIDGINVLNQSKTQYTISGEVDDMSDGESKKDFGISLEYIVSKDGIREIIHKGEVMPHKIKEFDMLRYPLNKGSKWTQQVEINGQKTELTAEIIEESKSPENNRILKVQYTAKVTGMPNGTYKEVRTFEEGKGLVMFENTFDKDIDFNYSLFEFNK